MGLDEQKHLEMIEHERRLFRQKQSGDPAAQKFLVSSREILRNELSHAVRFRKDARDGDAFFEKQDTRGMLHEHATEVAQAFQLFQSKVKHTYYPASDDCSKERFHLAWLLGDFASAETLLCAIDEASLPKVLGTKFWLEYHRAIQRFVARKPYTSSEGKWKGPERYWSTYLGLVEAVTNERPTAEAIRAVEEAFAKQNRDKRSIDWISIDGDGRQPVRWNVRLESFRRATPHYYGRSLEA